MTTDQPARFTAEETASKVAADIIASLSRRGGFARIISELDDELACEVHAEIQQAVLSALARQEAEPGEPSQAAMLAAVELEIEAAIGRVQTIAIGRIVQKAIDASHPPAPAPSTPGGWQPIETAPKDGTRILVCDPTPHIGFNPLIVEWRGSTEEWWDDTTEEGYHSRCFKFWAPIPPLATQPPPATGEGA